MATFIEKLVNQITYKVDDAGLRQSEKQINKFSKKLTGVGKQLTTKLTLPIAALGVTSVVAFNKQAQAIAQVEAAVASTGATAGFTSEQLQNMASELQANSLFGDEDILRKVTANLLTFTNVTGDSFQRAQKSIINLSARLDQDLQSSTIQLGKALNDPVANLGALSRTGIQFSEDQKKLIKTLAETNRIADAQAIIFAELEKQFGGAAKAAADVGTGSFIQFKNAVGDLLEEIGKIVFETLRIGDVFAWLTQKVMGVTNAIKNMSAIGKGLLVGIPALLAVIGPLSLAFGLLSSLAAAFGISLLPLVGKILLIAAAIGLVILVVDDLMTFFEGGDSIFGRFLDSMKKIWEDILIGGKWMLQQLWNDFLSFFSNLKNAFYEKLPFLKKFFVSTDSNNMDSSVRNEAERLQQRGAANRSLNVRADVNVGVPAGTPEEQQAALQASANTFFEQGFAGQMESALGLTGGLE